MLKKYFEVCAGQQSYSVGKALMQFIKSSETNLNNLRLCAEINPCRISFLRHASTKRALNEVLHNASEEKSNQRVQKSNSRKTVAKEIISHLLETGSAETINSLPKMCFKRNRYPPGHLCLAQVDAANTIFECIKDSVMNKGTIVLEANPGVGVLSKKLIEAGVEELHLHEPLSTFYKILKEFQLQNQDKVFLHSTDFLNIGKLVFRDKMSQGTLVKDMLAFYPKSSWADESQLKIIGHVLTLDFFKHLILNISFQNGIATHCRPEMFILVPPSLHLNLTCSKKDGYRRYRSTTVLFQTLFEYELLEKVPRKAFLPWPSLSSTRYPDEITALNTEWMYLMRIVPRKDLYNDVPIEKLPAYWYFVRHHFWRRSKRLIPEMESWIPGCGVRLILMGYNIFTEFGDLSPPEVLKIFQRFSSWPEYHDSSFLSSMETSLLKLDENSSENLEKPAIIEDSDENEIEKIE